MDPRQHFSAIGVRQSPVAVKVASIIHNSTDSSKRNVLLTNRDRAFVFDAPGWIPRDSATP